MRSGRIVRRVIMDRLIDQVHGVAGRVFDRATEGVALPYITMGTSSWIDDRAECIDGREMTLQVDIWATGNKGLCEDLVDDVAAALDLWGSDELAMHPCHVALARVMDDPDGVTIHGVVQVTIEIEDVG